MSRFTESHIASHRFSRLLASARLIERCLDIRGGRDRISGKFGRWNRAALGQSALAWLCTMERGRMELESTDDGITENTTEINHPWNNLTTVTAFDQGDNMRSTLRLNSINENQSNGKIMQGEQIANATGVLIESLLQQLCTMLEGDEVRRNKLYYAICDKLHELQLINNTYDTREYEILRGKYQHALYHMLTVARGETENKSVISIPRYLMPKLFRYDEEFREISFIARGGFGEVYKAQHRLDGIEYAVKKIVMPANRLEIINQQLNEVKALAKLNHTNIVSYKAAWIEPMLPSSYVSSRTSTSRKYQPKYDRKESKSSSLSIEDISDNKNGLNLNKSKEHHSKQEILLDTKTSSTTDIYIRTKERNKIYSAGDSIINKRFEELNSSINIIGKRIIEETNIEEYTEESSSDIVSFRNSGNNENLNQTIVDTEDTSSFSQEESSQELCMYTSNKDRRYITLYIQMTLCEQTLEQWLRGKISVTPEPMVVAIFQQILCGVDYMHSQKIVHHDIKPSNIFISSSRQLQIQLGDFGLACPLQKTENHQSVIGTHMYAAPEQLQGKCDPKSDIYSIGIILIELLISIKTKMELNSIVSCLKYGQVPDALKRYKWAPMIKQLVQEDPAKRPSTSQLMQDFNEDKDNLINGLKDTIVTLQNDNHDKDKTIQKLQEEIALLKEKAQKC